jgi:hypothetical protein
MTIDVHNLAAFENAFRRPATNLAAIPIFVEHFSRLLRHQKVAVVSPDIGGAKRAEQIPARSCRGAARGAVRRICRKAAERRRPHRRASRRRRERPGRHPARRLDRHRHEIATRREELSASRGHANLCGGDARSVHAAGRRRARRSSVRRGRGHCLPKPWSPRMPAAELISRPRGRASAASAFGRRKSADAVRLRARVRATVLDVCEEPDLEAH